MTGWPGVHASAESTVWEGLFLTKLRVSHLQGPSGVFLWLLM